MRAPFESTCAPSVASSFPLCIQYEITNFNYLPFVIDLIKRDHGISGLNLAAFRIHKRYCYFKVYTFYYIKSSANDFEEESVFSNRPKTLLYSKNGKAQIPISSVSQTKEIITDAGNRDQVFHATPLGLFSNLPKPLSISSCVKTYETCGVELWWLLLLADNFRRQNVEVQCFVAVSLSHDKKMKKRRGPALKF